MSLMPVLVHSPVACLQELPLHTLSVSPVHSTHRPEVATPARVLHMGVALRLMHAALLSLAPSHATHSPVLSHCGAVIGQSLWLSHSTQSPRVAEGPLTLQVSRAPR
jgi:hypothetical protein